MITIFELSQVVYNQCICKVCLRALFHFEQRLNDRGQISKYKPLPWLGSRLVVRAVPPAAFGVIYTQVFCFSVVVLKLVP